MNFERLNSIFEKIDQRKHTPEDIYELRQAIENMKSWTLQQSGKYNLSIGNGEDIYIDIGDKIYVNGNLETIDTLIEIIHKNCSLESDIESEEFQKATLNLLEDIESRLNDRRLFNNRIQQPALLKDHYIPIKVTLERRYQHNIETIWNYSESEEELKRIYALKGFDEEKQKNEIAKSQINWREIKYKHNKIIVLADPGMGKSTLLKMDAIVTAQIARIQILYGAKTVRNFIFPLYIRLSDLATIEKGIIESISILTKRYYPEYSDFIEKLISEKVKNGTCIFLFDGWDEVPQKHHCDLQRKLDSFVSSFIDKNRSQKIVLTSRIVGYRGSVINGAKEVEIIPFNEWQQEKYIEIWFKKEGGDIQKNLILAQKLVNELRQKPQIGGLAQNPLLLSLICSLYNQEGLSLPAYRWQLYKKALNYMLSEWQLDNRRAAGEEETRIILKKRLLETLAYEFTSEGKEWFWKEELVEKTMIFLRLNSDSFLGKADLNDLVKEICEENGIIQRLNKDEEISSRGYRYIFLHKTFQEFLSASYINENIGNTSVDYLTLIKTYSWDFNWHEILSLFSGLREDSSLMMNLILDQKDDIFGTQLLLVSRCICECKNPQSSLVESVIDKIYKLWQSHPELNCLQFSVVILGQRFLRMREKVRASLQAVNLLDRRKEVIILGKIDSSEMIPELFNFFHCNNSQRLNWRYASIPNVSILISLLEDINTLDSIQALVKLFKDATSVSYKTLLEQSLVRRATPRITNELIHVFKSHSMNPELKPCIANILGRIGDPNSVSALTIALLNNRSDPNQTYYDDKVRSASARSLGRIGDPSSVPYLVKALKDPYSSVRLSAVEALSKIPDKRAIDGLRIAFQSSRLPIQVSVLKALANMNLPEIDFVSILIDMFQRSNSRIRSSIAKALKDINSVKAISFFIDLLLSEILEIRVTSAEALGQLKAQEAIPALVQSLSHSEAVIRCKAAEALGKIGSPEAVPALIMGFKNREKFSGSKVDDFLTPFSQSVVEASLTKALGEIGTPEVVPILSQIVRKHPSWKVRCAAVEALGKVGTPEVIYPLFRGLEDSHGFVRGFSAVALEKTGNLNILRRLTYSSEKIIYDENIFPVFRRLAIKHHNSKVNFIPIHPRKGVKKVIDVVIRMIMNLFR